MGTGTGSTYHIPVVKSYCLDSSKISNIEDLRVGSSDGKSNTDIFPARAFSERENDMLHGGNSSEQQ